MLPLETLKENPFPYLLSASAPASLILLGSCPFSLSSKIVAQHLQISLLSSSHHLFFYKDPIDYTNPLDIQDNPLIAKPLSYAKSPFPIFVR